MTIELVKDDALEYPYYYNKRGEIPFWDHPLIKGYKFLQKNYRPHVSLDAVLSLYLRKIIDDADIMLLKVLGDSICSNEDQLRRYLASKMSRSDVSKRLDRFRRFGLVDRWKIRVSTDEDEEIKPPAPFTLGVAGYKFLKHFYNEDFFMDPGRWDTLGVGAVQRYVAMNELRCRLIEAKVAKSWKWNATIADHMRIKKPMGAAEIQTPKGNLNFLMERTQQSQDFVGFIRDKLYSWAGVYKSLCNLPIRGMGDNIPVVVLFTSTLSIANHLNKELLLDTFPFKIWICVEEDMIDSGLETAIYSPIKGELKRSRLDFLAAPFEG
ncbi:replication-relaxation family protein [Terribacillus saccharophilus]|uniref:replication-relaxation family protein n=1 Tax=Terribacillus saccharophilus TaxID=361277 RepID=UPI0038243AE7